RRVLFRSNAPCPELLYLGVIGVEHKCTRPPTNVGGAALLPLFGHERAAGSALQTGSDPVRLIEPLDRNRVGLRVHGKEKVLVGTEVGSVLLRDLLQLFPGHRGALGVRVLVDELLEGLALSSEVIAAGSTEPKEKRKCDQSRCENDQK